MKKSTILINGVECLTMAQAAAKLDCSYSRIAWLVSQGHLVGITPGTREIFVSAASIEAFRLPLKRGPKPTERAKT